MSEATALMKELRDIVRPWRWHDKIVAGEDRAKAIGRQLYILGGERLMQRAYYFATDVNPAASVLSAFWDGIGEWKW